MKNGGSFVSVYVSTKGKQYKARVSSIVFPLRVKRMTGAIHMAIKMYPPDARRRDVDNILKSLLDALQGAGVYKDDTLIDKLTIERCGKVEGGKVVVSIEEQGDLLP
jgi:crossover junction endodeoxyribonuclease RusA